jgi:hypothetical protein
MTIDRSGGREMQGKNGHFGEESGKANGWRWRCAGEPALAADDRLLVRTEFVTTPFARE